MTINKREQPHYKMNWQAWQGTQSISDDDWVCDCGYRNNPRRRTCGGCGTAKP